MQEKPPKPSLCGIATGVLALGLALGCGLDQGSARAQVSAGGLRTRVNGSGLGSCRAGVCQVQGGIQAGPNRFQRFSSFDTRPAAIRGVRIETGGSRNLVVGVSAPGGTFLNKPVQLRQPANLFWLSPGGIWLGKGGLFHQAPNLLLSTSSSLNLGPRSYNAITASQQEAAGFFAAPSVDFASLRTASGNLNALGLEGRGPVTLAGGLLTVEQTLAVDAGLGGVHSQAGAARSRLEAGETIRLRGRELELARVDLRAGNDTQRGLIHAQAEGRLQVAASSAEGAQVLLWGKQIQLQDSQLFAPRGLIRLESTDPAPSGTTLSLLRSQLDVGVRSAADLKDPAGFGEININNVILLPDAPTIALLTKGDLSVASSQLLASQDIDRLRRSGLPPQTTFQLSEASGHVVLNASGRLAVEQSRIEADATDNLAGNIGLIGEQGLRLFHTFLSASGGAGSGDLLLWSKGGITLEASTLVAASSNRPAKPKREPDFLPINTIFSGGEITLLNDSEQAPIAIKGSQLLTPYQTKGGELPYEALFINDPIDSLDKGVSAGGGKINLFSHGGIQISDKSLLEASGGMGGPDGIEPFGGVIQLINDGTSPLLVEGGSRLAAFNGPSPTELTNATSKGLIHLWSAGDLLLKDAAVEAASDQSSRPAPLWLALISTQNLELRNSRLEIQSNEPENALWMAGKAVKASNSILSASNSAENNLYIFTGSEETNLDDLSTPNWLSSVTLDPSTSELIPNYKPPLYSDALTNPEESAATIKALLELSKKTGITTDTTNVITADGRQLVLERDIGNLRRTLWLPTEASLEGPAAAGNSGAILPSWQGEAMETPAPQAGQILDPSTNQLALALSREATLERLESGEDRATRETMASLALTRTISPHTLTVPELQARLKASTQRQPRQTGPAADPNPYRPAVVRLNLNQQQGSDQTQIDLIYIPPEGELRGWRRQVSGQQLKSLIRAFQGQISRMEPMGEGNAAQQLQNLLLGPLLPQLSSDGITALVIAADRGLQAIPFRALPFLQGEQGSGIAITMTPALSLTGWESPRKETSPRLLLAGATTFANGLAPLPMVGQELTSLASIYPADVLLNGAFTASSLKQKTQQGNYQQIHIATHAEFPASGNAVIHTGDKPIPIQELGAALQPIAGQSPDLVSLSACRTSMGDERSELGLVGMALSAGSQSGIGTLWFVDDTANAAFFAQFYRYLKAGNLKDVALARTQDDFRLGKIQATGDKIINAEGAILLRQLSRSDQLRFANGFRHPYYWAGVILSGSPW